jgi:hypothetical protein
MSEGWSTERLVFFLDRRVVSLQPANRQTAQGAHMRFTLCKLFLGVTMAGLASAGMTLHTRLWAEAIVTFSIVLYAAVAILAFRSGGQARAFRITFAAVGGGYLLLVLCNTFSPIRNLLVTNRALVLAGQSLQVSIQPTQTAAIAPPIYIAPSANGGVLSLAATTGVGTLTANGLTLNGIPSFNEWDAAFGFGTPTPSPHIPAGAFLVIGHCVWSWLLALAAGCFAAFVCRPRSAGTPVGQS